MERWTATTVKKYFDSKNNNITTQDFTVSHPMHGCVMFSFKSVPDLARSFFRMAEHYEAQSTIDMTDSHRPKKFWLML